MSYRYIYMYKDTYTLKLMVQFDHIKPAEIN